MFLDFVGFLSLFVRFPFQMPFGLFLVVRCGCYNQQCYKYCEYTNDNQKSI